jgi:hypothetical protein
LQATAVVVPGGLDFPSSVAMAALLTEQGQASVWMHARRYAFHASIAAFATPCSMFVQQSMTLSSMQSASVVHALYAAGKPTGPASWQTTPASVDPLELLVVELLVVELLVPELGGPEVVVPEDPVLDDCAPALPLLPVMAVPPVPAPPVAPLELVPPMGWTSPLPQATRARQVTIFQGKAE